MSLEFKIATTKPAQDFSAHLSPNENQRIIFSAPFGSGKTYFLKEFFKENNENYDTIHIYPVNYSVASNEDIFQLIKVDILYKILELGDKIEMSDNIVSGNIKLGFYIQSHVSEIVRGFYSLYNQLNKDSTEIEFDVFINLT